jgi:uncharacterized protein Yka (UPF0111/DUF47 family)
MFSLQRFLHRGDRFFDLLGAAADEAQQSIRALVELVNQPQDRGALDKSIASRKQEKQIHQQITVLLCSTFMTPLEREDIEALAGALSRITKVAKKFAQRLLLFGPQVQTDIFRKQAEILDRVAGTLCEMVHGLRRGAHLDRVQEQNYRLQQYEGEADRLMLDLLGELYQGQHSALVMIATRDLLELLEKVIDRYRDAGNVVFQIALKNS